jgi:Xaa-Pro dipeptidase
LRCRYQDVRAPPVRPSEMTGRSNRTTTTPPDGLVEVQRVAIEVAEQAVAAAAPGMTEVELRDLVEEWLCDRGCAEVWSITNVGFGARSTICFPDQPPTDNRLGRNDVGHVDLHPISAAGWWGDCTRTFVLGSDPERERALAAVREIHAATLARCRPGMPASELFEGCHAAIEAAGYRLLDPWSNIGHSLRQGSAYDDKFIDAANETPMWGAWAVEPFLGTDAYGVKLEDVVWFGADGCTVVR